MFRLLDNMRLHKSFVSGQYLCSFFSSFIIFAEKFFVFAYFVVYFLVVFPMADLVSAVLRHGIMQLL